MTAPASPQPPATEVTVHIGDRVEMRVALGPRIGRVVDITVDPAGLLVDLGGEKPQRFGVEDVVSVDPARGER